MEWLFVTLASLMAGFVDATLIISLTSKFARLQKTDNSFINEIFIYLKLFSNNFAVSAISKEEQITRLLIYFE